MLSANEGRNNAPIVGTQFMMAQPLYPPLRHVSLPPAVNAIAQPELGPTPPPMLHLLPVVWPAATDLVEIDGRYQQSDQSPEIQACLKAAVRRANGNLAFVDGFPDVHYRSEWLGKALEVEFTEARGRSTTIAAVDDRAKIDQPYLNKLLHMVICFVSLVATQ